MTEVKYNAFSGRYAYLFLITAFCFSILATPFIFFLSCSIILSIIYYLKRVNLIAFSFKMHDYFLLLFIATVVISTLFSKNQTDAWEGFGAFCFYVLIYLFFKFIPIDRFTYRKIVCSISFSLCFFCLLALIHYLVIKKNIDISLFGLHTSILLYPDITVRELPLRSIFQHPWRGGNLIFILSTIVISYSVSNYKNLNVYIKVWLSITLIISFLTLYLTFTRAAIAGVIIVSILSFIFTRKYSALGVIVLLSIFLIAFKSDKIIDTLKNPLEAPNLGNRILQYRAGLEIYSKNNQLIGIGLLNFRKEFKKNYNNTPGYEDTDFIHSNYLSLLTETGALGLISFFIFLLLLFISSLKRWRRNPQPPDLNIITFLPAFFITSILDAVLYAVPIGIFLWIFAGLSQNLTLNDDFKKGIEGEKYEGL